VTLTERQQAGLDAIAWYIREHGYSPSTKDIQHLTGLKSPNSVTHLLNRLEIAGVIKRDPGVARSIRLL
jgi:repressor LexA